MATLQKKKKTSVREAMAVANQMASLQTKLSILLADLAPPQRQRVLQRANVNADAEQISGGSGAEVFDPFEAGRKAVVELQKAEGGAWTLADLQKLYGLDSANLHKRRAEYRIVWWKDPRSQFHYPKWQFNQAGVLLPGIKSILQSFKSSDEWRVMRYFLAPRHELDMRRPLDLLRGGEMDTVIAHAKAHGEENSW